MNGEEGGEEEEGEGEGKKTGILDQPDPSDLRHLIKKNKKKTFHSSRLVKNEENVMGGTACKVLNSTSCLDFIVFAFNMELCGRG